MSWDNTAPAALAAAPAQNNDAPGALAAAAAMSNVAPGALAAAAGHNNGAPSALAATVPGVPFVGDTTNGYAVVQSSAPYVALLVVGMAVRGAGIRDDTTIAALGATTVTLSKTASATAAGVTLTAFRPPATIAAAAAMDNTGPGAIAAAAGHSNVAPGALGADAAMSNIAPAALAADAGHNNAAPGALGAAAGADNTAPGSLSAATSQTNQPPQILLDPLSAPTDDTVNTPQIIIGGAMSLNSIHGQTRITAESALKRYQVQLDDAPTGGPATIQLINGNGDAIGAPLVVAAGARFAEIVFADAEDYIGLAAGTDVRAKCTTPGSVNAGGFGAVTLFLQLNA